MMRFVVATLVAISVFVLGCSGTSRYNNPYEDPRSQREYRQWVMGTVDKKSRADEFLRNENSWLQDPEQRSPVFQRYLNSIKETNARLQGWQDWQRSDPPFPPRDVSEFTTKKIRLDMIRYQKFLELRREQFNLLSPPEE